MLSQTHPLRRWTSLAKSLAALSVAALALPTTTQAATITALVDTPATLSFNFSGTGLSDFGVYNQISSSPFWTVSSEGHTNNPTTFSFSLSGLRDLAGGSAAPILTVTGAYGTTLSNTVSVAHGGGLDTFSLTVNVSRNDADTSWGNFTGSFSAVHTSGGVPDGGSTAGLAGLALLALAGARRFFRTA
ncbi:MAG: VPDSG-CTERM sorting domain-containing protein [Opitutaceae bacterium]|nr:VPDSG-CTERM sorting domain-containing protein [Opitutaceae bacterium]